MNSKKIVIFLCFVLMGLSSQKLFAENENVSTTYQIEKHNISIETPVGWTIVDKKSSAPMARQFGGDVPGFVAAFAEKPVATAPFMAIQFNLLTKNYSLDDYAKLLQERNSILEKRNPGAKCLENATPVTLNDIKMTKTIFRLKDETSVYYHFLRGQAVYSLIGSVMKMEKPDKYLSIFEQVAKSARFTGEAPASSFDLADAETLAYWAAQYYFGRQYDDAIVFGEEALKKNPDPAMKFEILFNLSSSYLEKGIDAYLEKKDDSYYKKSIEYGKQALTLQPNDWKVLANIATVHMNMDQLEEADKYYNEAEKYVDPKSPYAQQLALQHGAMKAKLDALQSAKKK